jgi:hypothetical protein
MSNPEIAMDPASKRRHDADQVEDPAKEVRRGTSGFKRLVLITYDADRRTPGAKDPTRGRYGRDSGHRPGAPGDGVIIKDIALWYPQDPAVKR